MLFMHGPSPTLGALAQNFSDEFCDPTKIFRGWTAEAPPRTCGLFGEVSLDVLVAKEPC